MMVADAQGNVDVPDPELLSELTPDGVLVLTLNRPNRRNALSLIMLDALADALELAEGDERVRVVVITGAGSSFCAGGDVKVMAAGSSIFGTAAGGPESRLEHQSAAQRSTVVRLWNLSKPTLAAVNGPAMGAGLSLALACDARLASDDAVLKTAFVDAGLAGDFGCSWLLTSLVGPARAKELMFFSPALTASQAEQAGLISEVYSAATFEEQVLERARHLAGSSALALKAIKSNVATALHSSLADASDAEVAWHVRLAGTAEHRAAVDSIATRRTS